MTPEADAERQKIESKVEAMLKTLDERGLEGVMMGLPEAPGCRNCQQDNPNARYFMGMFAAQVPGTNKVPWFVAMICLDCGKDQEALSVKMTEKLIRLFLEFHPRRGLQTFRMN